jgi:hypothetical protein
VTLLKSVEIAEPIKIEEAITLDLGGKSVTATSKKAFEVYANATIKNGEIIAANRCVDTRMAVELTLEGLKLTAEYTTTYGNSQPITIGGSENGTKVAMENVNVSANGGYGIITFVPTALAATNCTFSGYNALYVKPGSDNSSFEFVKSTLSGSTADNDVEGNSFSTIAVRANYVSVVVDAESKVVADGDYCHALSLGGNYEGEESVTGANVLVEGEITGNMADTTLDVYTFADMKHHTVSVEETEESILGGHGGGDGGIIRDFYEYLNGTYTGSSIAEIQTSVSNHLLTFAAEEARHTDTVVSVDDYFVRNNFENK